MCFLPFLPPSSVFLLCFNVCVFLFFVVIFLTCRLQFALGTYLRSFYEMLWPNRCCDIIADRNILFSGRSFLYWVSFQTYASWRPLSASFLCVCVCVCVGGVSLVMMMLPFWEKDFISCAPYTCKCTCVLHIKHIDHCQTPPQTTVTHHHWQFIAYFTKVIMPYNIPPGVSTVHRFAACIPSAAVGHYITLQISVHGITLPSQLSCLLVKSKSFPASVQKQGISWKMEVGTVCAASE